MTLRKIAWLLLLTGCGSLTGPTPNFDTDGEGKPKTGTIRIIVCPLEGCPVEPVDSTRTREGDLPLPETNG